MFWDMCLGSKSKAIHPRHHDMSLDERQIAFYPIVYRTMTQVKGGAAWSALEDIQAVHVSVAANAETVPYTSLRKDAIAHKEVGVVVVCIYFFLYASTIKRVLVYITVG